MMCYYLNVHFQGQRINSPENDIHTTERVVT